ncbi:hypothetical protein BN7_2458 [Wickerhamomyces ciferrii]|uniref:Uncharacterized protein n=1 Tax=Wickerhamomyces ciferrii (strain ATCC 14091 / BCRC 22168 / CBS 111 / JCM 3599 / NBRC 0793 / NRRL Y-1031 F-60-10) TaxID=1206466 RepID=K0KL55_WICCF|nr:uncharacterized protein BN7_2458 [Wickerhamomyces ciferrii]CCH42912.1 hypothetical protein BN7_2458 [Wickerhamomyces ciferrii]
MSTVIRSMRQLQEILNNPDAYIAIMFIDEENYPDSKKTNEKFDKLALEDANNADYQFYKIYLQKPGDIDVHRFMTYHREDEKVDNVFFAAFSGDDLIQYANAENEEEFDNIFNV